MCILILFMLYWTYLGCFIGHTYKQNTTNQGQRSESGWFSDVLQPVSSPTPTYGTINQPIEKQSRPAARDSVVNQWHAAPQTTPAQRPSSLAQPVYLNLPHYLPALVKPVPVCIEIRSKLLANECHVPSLTFGVDLQQLHDAWPRGFYSHAGYMHAHAGSACRRHSIWLLNQARPVRIGVVCARNHLMRACMRIHAPLCFVHAYTCTCKHLHTQQPHQASCHLLVISLLVKLSRSVHIHHRQT